jgi:ATP-dependent RNA helicase DDX56/DBP9
MSTEIQKTWAQQDFGLDKRLLKALSKMGFVAPTAVQAQCIPVAMQGRDVLVRSRTGSGKTAAFSLPLLHKLLLSKNADTSLAIQGVRAVVLAPTKELCKQIERQVIEITYYCRDVVNVCSLADDNASAVSYRLQSRPDVVISTPAKLVQQLKNSAIDLSMVETLVVDEADLVLSFGYAEDVQMVTSKMPKIFQGLLMSATLSPELEKFKRLVLHNPAVLKINETQSSGHLLQFYLNAKETDKYLILYVFMKLGLLQGKGLIFVNDVNKCYRLKLFLQQFFIPAAVLNSEVPLNSRLHILDVSLLMFVFPCMYLFDRIFNYVGVQ